jgi:hypothetical protein
MDPRRSRRHSRGGWALVALLSCVALLVFAPGALAAKGTAKISGTVTEASGSHNPIDGVEVEAFTATREVVGSAKTGPSGDYTIEGLAPGSYEVGFYPSQPSLYAPRYYNERASLSEAEAVSIVTEGEERSGIDAQLHEGGKITGEVTDTSGAGLENIEVFVSAASGNEGFLGEYEALTGAGGKYTVTGLPKGSYTVEFYPRYGLGLNFVPQYYEEKSLFSDATPVDIKVEGEVQPGIDAKLQEGGKVSGTVTDAVTHKPLAGVEVVASGAVGGGEEGFGGYAETNANGEYTILGLGSGTYKIEFSGPGGPTKDEYITQYYNGQSSFASGNLVTANQGSTTPGINAALVRKAPVNTAGPVASGTPAAGHALSCAKGSWTGEATLSYTYQWLRNGNAIAGANGSLYGVQTADQGTGLACKVTATNKHGTASAVSNTLTVPVPLPPPPPPKPVLTLLSFKITISGGSARVPIACANATCTGTIALTEQIVVKHRHHGRTRSKKETLVLGEVYYGLAAGHSATIAVYLTSTGRHALARARHHRLRVKVIAYVTGGASARESAVLSEIVRHRHR